MTIETKNSAIIRRPQNRRAGQREQIQNRQAAAHAAGGEVKQRNRRDIDRQLGQQLDGIAPADVDRKKVKAAASST